MATNRRQEFTKFTNSLEYVAKILLLYDVKFKTVKVRFVNTFGGKLGVALDNPVVSSKQCPSLDLSLPYPLHVASSIWFALQQVNICLRDVKKTISATWNTTIFSTHFSKSEDASSTSKLVATFGLITSTTCAR